MSGWWCEYDKPILDHLHQPERALELREGLRNLYSVLKTQDVRLRFVLLTGERNLVGFEWRRVP